MADGLRIAALPVGNEKVLYSFNGIYIGYSTNSRRGFYKSKGLRLFCVSHNL